MQRSLRILWAPGGALVWSLAAYGCSTAEAVEGDVEVLSLHEVANQVTVSSGYELLRLDGDDPVEGVGGAILLNSELVRGGTFREAGLDSQVEGGERVGSMHGECTTSGGDLSLKVDGALGTIAKCEQALSFFGRGQIIVSGLVEQQNFESNEPQHLAVIGGTGDFVGAQGELVVTQLVFPGIVKHLELRLRRPL